MLVVCVPFPMREGEKKKKGKSVIGTECFVGSWETESNVEEEMGQVGRGHLLLLVKVVTELS